MISKGSKRRLAGSQVETGLTRQVSRKKVIPAEVAPDEFADSAMKRFEINVFNVVYDTTTLQSIEKCFASHKDLY